jgi:hypothetical protein
MEFYILKRSLSLGMNFCRFSCRGRNYQGMKWPGTKWPRSKCMRGRNDRGRNVWGDEMTGTKWPGRNDRVRNERGRSVMPPGEVAPLNFDPVRPMPASTIFRETKISRQKRTFLTFFVCVKLGKPRKRSKRTKIIFFETWGAIHQFVRIILNSDSKRDS